MTPFHSTFAVPHHKLILYMSIYKKYVNNNIHSSFIVTNMCIHRKYVSYYSHSSFFIVTNFEI